MSIMVECRNCHNIFESEQAYGQICPKCGSTLVGTLCGGHTIAYQDNNFTKNIFDFNIIPTSPVLSKEIIKNKKLEKKLKIALKALRNLEIVISTNEAEDIARTALKRIKEIK